MIEVYEIDGLVPVVDATAFVHPSAVLIGDVIIGPGCYVGPAACLRGDFGRLILERGANIQDTCVMHGFPNTDTVIEEDGHVGHGAVLHGCRIGRNAMVGMNAVVMDNATIGADSIVAALALVKADTAVPPRSLVAGVPARVIRELRDEEIAWKAKGTRTYQQLAVRSANTMRRCAPLAAVESGRKRIEVDNLNPLYEARRTFGD
ncbi:MAG: phenylacetic acid degradation protein PaaY [Rhodospirillales bacterium]